MLLLLLVLPFTALAQSDFQLEKIPNDQGSTQNMISCITQDEQGFIWVGTPSGLNRYVGYQFKVFKYSDQSPRGLITNQVKDLLVDSPGWMWIATASGLQVYG